MNNSREKNEGNMNPLSVRRDSESNNILNYLKINGQNRLEEIDYDSYIKQSIIFSSTLVQENEYNIGKEINKFFDLILPENKEVEPLKVNIAISNRYKEKNVNKQINDILNKKFSEELVLNDELSENISAILISAYQKIQNKYKFNSFDELMNEINNYNLIERDILKDYLIKEEENKKTNFVSSPKNQDYEIKNFFPISNSKKRKLSNSSQSSKLKNISPNKKEKKMYDFKEPKNDKTLPIPIEMLILKRKFDTIKKLKLIVSYSRSKKIKIYLIQVVLAIKSEVV